MNRVLPDNTPTESVHALKVIVPATWAKRDEAGLRELQTYAGAMPEEKFSIDPSRLKMLLHDQYARFVLDVTLPEQSGPDKEALQSALTNYEKAFDAYESRLEKYLDTWDKRKKDLKDMGEKIDAKARLTFRQEKSGFFTNVQGKLDAAAIEVQKYSPPNSHWAIAIRNMRDEITSAQSDLRGLYTYEGGEATLEAVKNQCDDKGPGWDSVTFNSSVDSQSISSSAWNANGSYGGSFFSIGGSGGGDSYQKIINTANDNVSLRFCNLTYISLRPGSWFDISFLQEIDAGTFKLKPGSAAEKFVGAGKKILGPSGAIARLVKGAIVARSINFDAHLSTTHLDEMKKSSSGSGGIRIGPWQIGGGGGSTEFKKEYTTNDGGYGRSTATEVPVIIAIITEPTK